MKILIVEDNPDDRLLLKINLEAHNCEVIEAADGFEGFEAAQKHKPALIISDGLMPRMDGFQFLHKVRRDDELKAIPFIFYSATYTGHEDVELARSLGADAYIFKPKEPDEFWEELLKILDECRLKKGIEHKKNILHDEEYLRRYADIVATKLEKKIIELENAKDCAEESRKQYQKLFDSSLDGIYRTDEKSCFVQANSAFAKMLGFDRVDEMMGISVLDFWIDSEDRNRYMQELKEKKGLSAYPVNARKRNGEELYLEISSNMLEDEKGRFLGIEGIVRDMTGHRKLEEQLRHAQKLEGIGQLAGGIAHDFNNVLNAVVGYAGLLQMKMDKSDPQRNYAEEIMAAGHRGAALTRQILAFSRKQVLDMKPVNLNEIVRGLEKMLHRLVREDISIKLELFKEDLVVLADASQIDQVLINLVTNARDAMSKGGTLSITTEPFVMNKEFDVLHGYGNPGEYAMITVSDTGIGMDAVTKTHIFEPFFTTKGVGKGTGLGLAVVHGIVKQHGGYINVYSEVGKGTIINILLPLLNEESGMANGELTSQSALPVPQAKGETILIAEDEASLRKMSATVLSSYGYKVIEAVDGEDAMLKFTENKDLIKLVILDGIMPKKNGKEVFDEIRKICPYMRAVFVSGYAEDIFTHDGIPDKAAVFMQKPLKPDYLLRVVREELDR